MIGEKEKNKYLECDKEFCGRYHGINNCQQFDFNAKKCKTIKFKIDDLQLGEGDQPLTEAYLKQ